MSNVTYVTEWMNKQIKPNQTENVTDKSFFTQCCTVGIVNLCALGFPGSTYLHVC